MQDNGKNINEILSYLDKRMSEEDRYVFERKMQADPFLMDAVEGYEKMSVDEIEAELGALRDSFGGDKKSRLVPMWMRAAASVVLLLGIGTLIMLKDGTKEFNLVSDHVDLRKKDKTELIEEGGDRKEVVVLGALGDKNEDNELNDQLEYNEPVRTNSAKSDKIKRKSLIRAKVREDKDMQEVDMALRYENSAVKAERELVGEITGVDLSEVEGSGGGEPAEIMIRGVASLYKDTSYTSFRGRVVDEAGIPLSGVNVTNSRLGGTVSEKFINSGTVTDTEGNFEIEAPESGAVLQLSSVGFKDQLAIAKNDSIGDVVMESEQLALDAVVPIGYGSQKRVMASNKEKKSSKARMGSGMEREGFHVLAEPEGGINKLIRKLERKLRYPSVDKNETKLVRVEVFISISGELLKADLPSGIPSELKKILKNELTEIEWQTPRVNGMPVESYRTFNLNIKGSK